MPEFGSPRSLARAGLLVLVSGLAVGSLVSCGGNARAPVEDREGGPRPRTTVQSVQTKNLYRVQRGDTLYSIAFRYGLDYRKVAAANRIAPPYQIFPGQNLVLEEAALPPPAPAATDPGPAQSPVKPPLRPATPPAPPKASPAPPAAVPVAVFVGRKVGAWRWPADGPLTRGFSDSLHKGIDIGGRRGDPVRAAAPGKVVYAGTGIRGFGELLIVKHNEEYLSAYGHNDRLLVKEGQEVGAGEQIAEKGSSGTDSVKLHFEIRREGKPVDPQRLLPGR